jgi:hypothetical protein
MQAAATRQAGFRGGPLATGLGLGLMGAGGADMLAHDELDYSTDSLEAIRTEMGQLQPAVAEAVLRTVGSAATPELRSLVMATLSGAPPEQVLAAVPEAPKEIKDLIKMSGELAAGAPQVAAKAVDMGMKMSALDQKVGRAGLELDQVVEAANTDTAGHSSLPAILGGAGLGTGAALLHHLMAKRAAAQ